MLSDEANQKRLALEDMTNRLVDALIDEATPKTIKRLLDNGADPNDCGTFERTMPPLCLAILYYSRPGHRFKVVKTLLEHGADPNQQNIKGRAALHFAYFFNPDDRWIIRLLLKYGANPKQRDYYGKTPKYYIHGDLLDSCFIF